MDSHLLNENSREKGRTCQASLVKFLTPGHIVLDVHDSTRNFIEEDRYMREIINYLTLYWNAHHQDPIEGRIFQPGEAVSVKLGAWRPALITDFCIVDSMHVYELIILDCGQIIKVHRTLFRDIPPHVTLQCRYAFFLLIDIFPIEGKERKYGTWSTDSCKDLRLLFEVASVLNINIQAVQLLNGYQRLFGNIYLQVGTEVIDVRDRLLQSNEAFEDADQFRRLYGLREEDYNCERRREVNEPQSPGCMETVPVEVEKITDANLDKFLLPGWRLGGNDSLSQVERNNMRYRLTTESHITFAPPCTTPLRRPESSTPNSENNHITSTPRKAKSVSTPSAKCDVSEVEKERPNSVQTGRGIAEIKTEKSHTARKPPANAGTTHRSPDVAARHDSHEVQVVSGELREKLLKSIFTSPPTTPPNKTSSLSSKDCSVNERKVVNQENGKSENAVSTSSGENHRQSEMYENEAGIQIVTGELCDKLTKLFSPSDGKSLLQQNSTPYFVLDKNLVRGSYFSEKKEEKWLGCGALTATTGLSLAMRCAISPTFQQDATKLQLGAVQTNSHEQQIRQASSMTVDAASQLLSQTVFAFIEVSRSYRDAMDDLMNILSDDNPLFMMDAVENEDGNTYNIDVQEFWEQEIDTRGRVNTLRNSLLELASYMEYVTKVATAAAEASFLAGSEFASTSMCERINSAHRAFEEEKAKNKEAERELLKIQENNAATFGKAEAMSPALQPSLRGRRTRMETATLIDPLADDNDTDSDNKSEK